MKTLTAYVLALFFAMLVPHVALAAPDDPCRFIKDPAEQAQCRVYAAAPANGAMFRRCADLMVKGLCEQLADPFAGCDQLEPDKRQECRDAIGRQEEAFSLRGGVKVTIPKSIVFRVRGLQTARPDDLTMCRAAADFCDANPKSLECLVGRVNWGRTADWGR